MYEPIFYNAKADIKGGKNYPNINGEVFFIETKLGIIVTIKINGLPSSNNNCKGKFFGFHIHDGTSCTGNNEDEFSNSKGHYNPNNCTHPFHAGDLPPLLENNGFAYMSFLINKFTIKEILGKAIIIHDFPDDFTTQPSRKFRDKNCLWYNKINQNNFWFIHFILLILIIFSSSFWKCIIIEYYSHSSNCFNCSYKFTIFKSLP